MGDFSGGIATRLSNNFVAVFLAQAVGLAVAGALLLVSGEPRPATEALAWGAAAGVSGTFGLGSFYLALSRGTMGLVAPAAALLSAAWPAAFALLTGDSVGTLALAGMVVALVAIVLISLPDRRLGTPAIPTYHGSRRSEWLLILGAALGFGGFFLLIDASHEAGGAVWWPLLMVKVAGVSAVIVAAVVLTPLGRFPGIRLGTAALLVGTVAGVGDLGGNLFFVLASGEGELAVVIVLTSLYPVVTAILARVFLHERLSPLRLLGVALAIGGVVLIGLPGDLLS
ncbi:MAG: DMT family transporter [Candidatus Limnocylindrales bacterium]